MRCSCGLTCESDFDALPEEARAAFVREGGRWAVVLDDLGPHRVEALAALRSLTGVSPSEAIAIAKERRRIFEGARVEVETVAERLAASGAVTALEVVGGGHRRT